MAGRNWFQAKAEVVAEKSDGAAGEGKGAGRGGVLGKFAR